MIYLSKKILKYVGRANGRYELIKEADRVLVGLSGGKDSFVLLHILNRIKQIAPFDFELTAITIDADTGVDYTSLKKHCEKHNINYILYKTPIFEIIQEKKRPNSSACSFCARMRRGSLYTKALELGYNKLALGHHLDDSVESFFMNLFYNGMMRAMPPKYTAENGLEVIRPLIHVRERQIIGMAEKNDFPIINGEETCLAIKEGGEKQPYAREKIKKMLISLEEENPKIFTLFEAGFKNIYPETFFDTKYLK